MSDERPTRSEFAEARTDLAEDRTLLANERTFSGWTRTALATVGVGLGFEVLFRELQPLWVPKAIATLFVALGILIIFMAERRASAVRERLSAHQVRSLRALNLKMIALIYTAGAVALVVALWILV